MSDYFDCLFGMLCLFLQTNKHVQVSEGLREHVCSLNPESRSWAFLVLLAVLVHGLNDILPELIFSQIQSPMMSIDPSIMDEQPARPDAIDVNDIAGLRDQIFGTHSPFLRRAFC